MTDAEKKTLDDWIAGGAKRSSDSCGGEAPSGEAKPLACDAERLTLKASRPFAMNGGPVDQYVCFGIEVPSAKKRHVVGLAPKVDNTKIVHHILLFQAKEAVSPEPFACDATGSSVWKMVTGWAPGGGNLELPPEAGYPMEQGTTHWVVQMHYNNAQGLTGQVDDSGYELCATDQLRPNDAGVLAFGSVRFSIPPRATHTIRCDYKLDSRYQGVKFFGASPHMHTLGASIVTERIPGGNGAPEEIFGQSPFSFENQENFAITPHKGVAPGDVLRTRCSWKNPTDAVVKFGEGTGDEMCFNFLTYYPNIPDKVLGIPILDKIPLQTWVTPSAFASCTAE